MAQVLHNGRILIHLFHPTRNPTVTTRGGNTFVSALAIITYTNTVYTTHFGYERFPLTATSAHQYTTFTTMMSSIQCCKGFVAAHTRIAEVVRYLLCFCVRRVQVVMSTWLLVSTTYPQRRFAFEILILFFLFSHTFFQTFHSSYSFCSLHLATFL